VRIRKQEKAEFVKIDFYRAFQDFGQAKFAYGGSILGLNQLTQMPLKRCLI